MGVASGLLRTTPEYEFVRGAVIRAKGRPPEGIKLSVREPHGEVIPAQGGVVIEDYSEDIGPNVSAAEVSILGVPYPLYEKLFPAHVVAYKQQFSK